MEKSEYTPTMLDEEAAWLRDIFAYHKPANDVVARYHNKVRESCLDLARNIYHLVPFSPERDLAIERLREVMMWANAGIAIHSNKEQ